MAPWRAEVVGSPGALEEARKTRDDTQYAEMLALAIVVQLCFKNMRRAVVTR